MDLLKFERVWDLSATILNHIKMDKAKVKGDQWFLVKVQEDLPNQNKTAIMPDEWSTHGGHGFCQLPQKVYTARQGGTGMLHFSTAPYIMVKILWPLVGQISGANFVSPLSTLSSSQDRIWTKFIAHGDLQSTM